MPIPLLVQGASEAGSLEGEARSNCFGRLAARAGSRAPGVLVTLTHTLGSVSYFCVKILYIALWITQLIRLHGFMGVEYNYVYHLSKDLEKGREWEVRIVFCARRGRALTLGTDEAMHGLVRID